MFNETLVAAFLTLFMPQPAHAAEAPVPPAPTVQNKAQDRIYGSQLMTAEEREAYRARMKQAQTYAEREKIRQEHHAQMQQRAKERGLTLPDQPRSRPRAGRGEGDGPGPGAGAGRGPNR